MSRLKFQDSGLVARSEINLFQIPHTQIGIEKTQWLEIPLKNSLSNTGPFEFVISQNPYMLQLSKNYLFIECRILDKDDKPITEKITDPTNAAQQIDAPHTGPIQLLAKTFIKKLQLSLNGNQIYDSGPNYAYRAYLETELMHGYDSKKTYLAASGYVADDDAVDADNNRGFKARATPFREGKSVQLMGSLHCDLFQQDRFLLPNIELRLTVFPNSNAFNLLNFAGGEYKLDFQCLKLYVKSVELMKSYYLSLERTLPQTPAKYPLKRVATYNLHITQSRRSIPENDIFGGIIPRRVIIGCVKAAAFHGDIKKSPFYFEHFNLSEIYIRAGGERYPNIPLSPDYANNNFIRAYMQLMEGLGYAGSDTCNTITPKRFKNGWCIYCFDLSPTQDDGDQNWNLERKGSTSIHLEFKEQIPDGGIEVIIWAEFDSMLSIDGTRNCFTDYIS